MEASKTLIYPDDNWIGGISRGVGIDGNRESESLSYENVEGWEWQRP